MRLILHAQDTEAEVIRLGHNRSLREPVWRRWKMTYRGGSPYAAESAPAAWNTRR